MFIKIYIVVFDETSRLLEKSQSPEQLIAQLKV
jgi:hypothetical protein